MAMGWQVSTVSAVLRDCWRMYMSTISEDGGNIIKMVHREAGGELNYECILTSSCNEQYPNRENVRLEHDWQG